MKYRSVQRIFLMACGLFVINMSLARQSHFQLWSERVFVQVEKEYGYAGAERMRKFHRVMVENINESVDVKLRVINDSFNQLPWVADDKKHQINDYWATPLETIATFSGDCEDIAIAKYMALRMMGISRENMQLAHVKVKRTGKPHMVLVYISRPDQSLDKQPLLILDNLDPAIKQGKERKDLRAVYLIDHDRNVTLLNYEGSQCSVFFTRKNVKAKKLTKFKKKMLVSNARYEQHNNGRPLFLVM